MRTYLAEMRDAWGAWLGVSLGIVVTNFAVALSTLVTVSGSRALAVGEISRVNSSSFIFNGSFNLLACAVIGMAVVSSATGLVVDARRGAIARFLLAGATPAQVKRSLLVQLAMVSVACSVIASLAALLALKPALALLTSDRATDGLTHPPTAVYSPPALLAAAVGCVGVAVLGGRQQARRASDVPPVEALRQSQSARRLPMTRGRWAGAVAIVVVVVAMAALLPLNARLSGKETISNVLIASLCVLMLAGGLIALLAPALVAPVTRAWTALVPRRFVTFSLARSMVIARADRLTKSVVPAALAIGITFGNIALGTTLTRTLAVNGMNVIVEKAGITTFLITTGLPLIVALSAGVGVLIMMSRQRDAELALSGIVGTTPAQRIALPTAEGVIITGTAAVLGALMSAAMIGFMGLGFSLSPLRLGLDPSPAAFVVPTLVSGLIVVAATVLPTLPALSRPEPKVLARLVAE